MCFEGGLGMFSCETDIPTPFKGVYFWVDWQLCVAVDKLKKYCIPSVVFSSVHSETFADN